MFLPNARILICDDMKPMLEMVKRTLMQMGFMRIQEAADGQQAWDMMKKARHEHDPYEVVISDWNMPLITGLDLLRLVRAEAAWENLPFFILTTESEKGKILEAIAAGATNYMVKPLNENVLREKLERAYSQLNP